MKDRALWIILNIALPILVVLGTVRLFLRPIIATFFQLKAERYLRAARFQLTHYPPSSFGYQRGNMLLAIGELYCSLAQAFDAEYRE